MASAIYNNYKESMLNGGIDLENDTIKVALCTSSYTPDIDADEFYDDIDNEVANGSGYTTGGETISNPAVTQDDVNDQAVFTADATTWTSSTITARYAVIYKDTGTASTSPLIGYIDFAEDKSSVSGDFTINWDEDGILTVA